MPVEQTPSQGAPGKPRVKSRVKRVQRKFRPLSALLRTPALLRATSPHCDPYCGPRPSYGRHHHGRPIAGGIIMGSLHPRQRVLRGDDAIRVVGRRIPQRMVAENGRRHALCAQGLHVRRPLLRFLRPVSSLLRSMRAFYCDPCAPSYCDPCAPSACDPCARRTR